MLIFHFVARIKDKNPKTGKMIMEHLNKFNNYDRIKSLISTILLSNKDVMHQIKMPNPLKEYLLTVYLQISLFIFYDSFLYLKQNY